MDEMDQAHHELDRLQGIISRHETHMFALRGWLLTVIGGVLAAYYTGKIAITATAMRVALPAIALLFVIVETRHENLVEAVAHRAMEVEQLIAANRKSGTNGWYEGPKVSAACKDGATRLWPKAGMTFMLYLPFYLVVLVIILGITLTLPRR